MASSNRPPPHLKGKEIGLWYARRSRNNRLQKSLNFPDFTLDQKTVEKIAQVVKDTVRIGGTITEHNDYFQVRPKTSSTLSSSENLHLLDERTLEDNVVGFEDVDGSDYANSVNLLRNGELDKSLQKEMIDKIQAPCYVSMDARRKTLPAFSKKQEFLDLVDANQVVVVSGDTGCGKTTQLPQYLLEHAVLRGNGSCTRVVVTQPRRISAISVAERVAAERGQRLGVDVGYQIRLDAVMPKRPQGSILYCTTGIVLQWFHFDPLLKSVSHIVVDEVHEREVLGDFLIAMLKRILPLRPDLRVILMSATMNAEKFSQFFDGCPQLEIPGRTFPVETFYLEDVLHKTKFEMNSNALYKFSKANQRLSQQGADSIASPQITPDIKRGFKSWLERSIPRLTMGSKQFLEAVDISSPSPPELVARVIDYIVETTTSGAVLVFVPGLADIKGTMRAFHNLSRHSRLVEMHALHSRLSTVNQRAVFNPPPPGKRKVIVATNIAETSITIEDVVYVVDCGYIKVTTYDPRTNTSTLAPVLVSKANAAQRRGRAGRVCAGQCYHLFSEFTHDRVMLDFLPPEITRVRLEDIILRIKALNLGPVTSILSSCLDPPDLATIVRTLQFLRDIQALKPLPLNPAAASDDSIPTAQLSHMSKRQRDRLIVGAISSGFAKAQAAVTASTSAVEDNDVLTPLGHHLANLPLDPQCAKLLLLGTLFCCLRPALAVAACLSFKEPFEVPMGMEAEVDKKKLMMTQDSQSDHWAFHVALSEYMSLRPNERYNYCRANYLNPRTMVDLCNLMSEFVNLLYERRYVSVRDMNDEALNRYSYDVRIFRAVIAGAFYPNVVMATSRSPSGFGPPMLSSPSSNEKVTLHSKSVNNGLRPFNHLWFTYFQKMKLDHGAASTIFDSTMLSTRPVVFFASNFNYSSVGDNGILLVDNWIKFNSTPRTTQLIESLRQCMDRLLNEKVRNPGPTNWDTSRMEGRVMQTIVDFFVTEAPAAFEKPVVHAGSRPGPQDPSLRGRRGGGGGVRGRRRL